MGRCNCAKNRAKNTKTPPIKGGIMDNNQNHFLSYLNRNTYDGHGGRARMHHEEMEAIARRVYAEEHEKDKKEM